MKILDSLTRIGVILPASVAIIVSVLDLFDLLTSLPWLKERLTPIILLLIALFITFEVYQERDYSLKTESDIQKSTNRLVEEIKSLHGVEVIRFEDVAKFYDYISGKLNTASKSVDDITWGSRKGYRTKVEEEAYNNYLKAQEQVCKKGTIKYREVSSLTDQHYFQRSMNLIDKKYYSYHLGYYDISANPVPLMSFITIDSKEVLSGFYRVPRLPSEGEVYLSVSQPNLVKLFEDYFETLWVGSTKIKEADIINHDQIEAIKKKLKIED